MACSYISLFSSVYNLVNRESEKLSWSCTVKKKDTAGEKATQWLCNSEAWVACLSRKN